MERLRISDKRLVPAVVLVAGLLLGACGDGDGKKDNKPSKDETPFTDIDGLQQDSDWKITKIDELGMTDYHNSQGEESSVYFVEYTDNDGNTLICKEMRPWRIDSGPTESCNWEEYNQEANTPK